MIYGSIEDMSGQVNEAINREDYICVHISSKNLTNSNAIIPDYIELSNDNITLSGGHYKLTLNFSSAIHVKDYIILISEDMLVIIDFI